MARPLPSDDGSKIRCTFKMPEEKRIVWPDELAGHTIPVLSIRLPYPTLIAMGIKRYETRGWLTKYRGPILIQCGKTCGDEEVANWNTAYQFISRPGVGSELDDLQKHVAKWDYKVQLGSLLAVADMIDCEQLMHAPDPVEEAFGTFGRGRYGFRMARVCPLSEPIPLRGMQGIFEHTFPAVEKPEGPAPF